jgi:hypothetical protein
MTAAARLAVVLIVLLTGMLVGPLRAAGAADDPPLGGTEADRVLVIGIPGLTWADVDPEATPQLWALAGESAIGAVSVRAARSTTCLLDGWATLGAGNRARVPGPDDGLPPVPLPTVQLPEDPAAPTVPPTDPEGAPEEPLDTSLSHCGLQEEVAEVGLIDPAVVLARTAADEGTARFGAVPGALGTAVGCATVSGWAATLAVAAPGVAVSHADVLPQAPEALGGVLAGCPLTLVSLDDLTDAGEPGPRKTDDGTEPALRAAALTEIDAGVGRLRAAVAGLPGDTLLLLTGISEVNDGRSQLHVGMVSGPGFAAPAWLSSPSTGRAPFAQLIDVAPTALRALGLAVPASMNGSPLQAGEFRPALPAAVAELELVNTAATVHHRNTSAFFWFSVAVVAGLVALGMLVLGGALRRPVRATARRPGRAALRTAAVAAGALPVATYLAGLAPWERAGSPAVALVAAVLVADLAVAALAVLGPWRRHRFGPPLAVLAITFLTLVADVLTGSHLELNGLLGYDAIVAGRFTGYGNLTFGLLAVSALAVTAAAATALGRRADPSRARAVTAATVLGVGLLTVAVIGAPNLGRDFGGVAAALPGFLLLAMLLGGIRVTAVRLGGVLAAGVIAVTAVAVLDWRRGPEARTHLGRFVEQVLTGEAWTVVSRKAQANLDILLGSPLAWMLPVAAVAAVWLLRPGGLLRSAATGPDAAPAWALADDVVVLRAALLASLLSLAVGAAVNDSGVALPATAAALLVPLLVWLAAGTPVGGTGSGETASRSPRPDPAEGAGRVTVVSRGSTVWNT